MININEVIYGLEFTKAMITFNPSTGEEIEPENLNGADKTTYDACVSAIALLKERDELFKHEYWRGYNNGRTDERGLQEGTIIQMFSPD